MITLGRKYADAYRVASMKKFEALAQEHAGEKPMPKDYAEQCHIAGAAAIDATLIPWWKRLASLPSSIIKPFVRRPL